MLASQEPLALASASGDAAIFWQSDPIRPNQTAIITGESLDLVVSATLIPVRDLLATLPDPNQPWTGLGPSLDVQQASRYSVKFLVPASLRPELYAYQLQLSDGRLLAGVLNRPEVWWAQGIPGTSLVPGRQVRVFGRNLGWELEAGASLAMIILRGPRTVVLPALSGLYSASTVLPSDLPPGDYQLSYYNGMGGPGFTSVPIAVTVAAPDVWPQVIYSVASYGAHATGSDDDTPAVQAAIDAASANGGGVVFFPRGRYFLSTPINIPRRVTLRGQGPALVNLQWHDDPAPPPAYVQGEGEFAIEGISFSVSNYHNVIRTSPSSQIGKVRLDNVRIRANPYIGHLEALPSHDRMAERTARGYLTSLNNWGPDQSALSLSGPDIAVLGCDVYSGNNALFLLNTSGSAIIGSRFFEGLLGGYYLSNAKGVIFEDNEFFGGDPMSAGGGIEAWTTGKGSEHIYYAGNRISRMFGNDREAMTSDASGTGFFGPVIAVSGTSMTLGANQHPAATPGPRWLGEGIFVVSGKGAGQYRRIVSFDNNNVQVDSPWTLEPDSTSVVSIVDLLREMLFVGNRFEDCGVGLQYYGSAVNVIAAKNRSERTVGFHAFGLDYYGIQPSWFVQFVDNEIAEGNSYRSGANNIQYSGEAHIGSYQLSLPQFAQGSLLTRATIIRGNILSNNAHIEIASDNGTNFVHDVVVEHNTVEHAAKGIVFQSPEYGFIERDNTFDDVSEPIVIE